MDTRTIQLHPDRYFHIYNRGVNGGKVFFEEKNYSFFLKQYAKYVHPFVQTYAYCLLGNHFHFMIRVRTEGEINAVIQKSKDKPSVWHVSNAIASFLQSFSQSMNKKYDRSGSLFEKPFKRIEVTTESYFSALVSYIHFNPERHGVIDNFRDYLYSSYQSHLSEKPTLLNREEVIGWFGNKQRFQAFHLESKLDILSTETLLE